MRKNAVRKNRLPFKMKHGLTDTDEHNIWCDMRKRCYNPRSRMFKYYGGRHIRICKRWDDFATFLADMGPRPSPKHSLDRVNNWADYQPDNCRWATRMEQMRNTRSNMLITHNGQTLCCAAWAEKLDLDKRIIWQRIKRGETPERALSNSRLPRRTL